MVERAEVVAEEVLALLQGSEGEQYFGEAVTKLEHAAQCAWHAMQAGADEELVVAALLHDIGHLLQTTDTMLDARVGVINHDETGARWLRERGFSDRVAELVGGHVNAKRYLVTINQSYRERLSVASQETLRLQGGPMQPTQAEQFAQDPYYRDKLRLRSWDEAAKDPSWQGPGIETYSHMLLRHLSRQT